VEQKTENPHFLETDELWSTHLNTFGKPSQDPRNLYAKVKKRLRYGEEVKNGKPRFLETDEHWSTYFNIFGKPSGRVTRLQKLVGQSSKTAEI